MGKPKTPVNIKNALNISQFALKVTSQTLQIWKTDLIVHYSNDLVSLQRLQSLSMISFQEGELTTLPPVILLPKAVLDYNWKKGLYDLTFKRTEELCNCFAGTRFWQLLALLGTSTSKLVEIVSRTSWVSQALLRLLWQELERFTWMAPVGF